MRTHVLAIAIAALVTLPACGKKKEADAAAATAGKAGDKADKTGEKAGKPGEKIAEGAAKAAGAAIAKAAQKAAAPAPEDVKLEAGDNVVAWLSVRSLGALFDAVETIGGEVGMLPPGASMRGEFYQTLTRVLADNGVTGHEWLDKAKPVHAFLQDDNPADISGGAVIMLPVTDQKKAMAAIQGGKKGADAAGHAAVLKPVKPGQKVPDPTAPDVFIDFQDGYMIVASNADRFAKAKAFAGRIAASKVPALAYLGISIADAGKTRKAQIEAMLGQLERMEQANSGGMGGDYTSKMMKQWVTDLVRFELTVDGDAGYVRVGSRLQAKAGSELDKQFKAGRGRDARPAADSLPGNAFLTFVADMDTQAGLNQLDRSMKMLRDMFQIDAEKTAELDKDIRAAAKLQDGTSALAVYRDGAAAAGALAWIGTRDPAATLKMIKNVVAEIGLAAIARERAEKGKTLNKAEEAQFAVVERALKARKLEPILTTYGPMAKEMGVKLTSNLNKDGDASCEVLDIELDWTKIARPGDEQAKMAQMVIGDRTAVALCIGKQRLGLSTGPSALEQGRRSVLAKKGGLVDSPVYKAAAARAPAPPSGFMYANVGAGVAAFEKVMPPLPVKFPSDRPVTASCGNRAMSFACELSVPVQVIAAAKQLAGAGR